MHKTRKNYWKWYRSLHTYIVSRKKVFPSEQFYYKKKKKWSIRKNTTKLVAVITTGLELANDNYTRYDGPHTRIIFNLRSLSVGPKDIKFQAEKNKPRSNLQFWACPHSHTSWLFFRSLCFVSFFYFFISLILLLIFMIAEAECIAVWILFMANCIFQNGTFLTVTN